MTVPSRQLVQPTSHIPWSVDVIRLVPKKLKDVTVNTLASCSSGDWGALTTGDGYIHLWYEPSKSLSEKIESSKDPITVFLPDLIDETEILLALSPSSPGSIDSVHLYVWHAGWLYLKRASTKEFASSVRMRPHNTKTKVDLQDGEVVTSISAAPGFVVLSTSYGNLHWVTATAVPVGLHVQRIKAEAGFLSRLVFGSDNSSSTGGTSPCHVLPISATEFLSIAQEGGQLMHWKTTVTVGTAHYAKFELASKTFFALQGFLDDVKVVRAALSPNNTVIHAMVSGMDEGIDKLYWIQAGLDGSISRKEWVNRFAEPSQVSVLGLTVTENESSYAAFYQSTVGSVIAMALCPNEEIIQEVELPTQSTPSVLPNTMEPDTRTHGFAIMASTGLGLRVRYIPREVPPSAKKARLASYQGSAPVNSALVSHLRSSFWQAYQDPETHRPLPPSLPSAAPDVLTQAIVTFATELQHKGDASSAQNPIEWHRALVRFLQDRGLYRNVATDGRWQLVSVGQELAVFQFITQYDHGSMVDGDCKSYGLAEWLLAQQDISNPDWNELLCGVLNAAMHYRENNAAVLYDVLNTPTSPLWLSHSSIQRVIKRQMEGHVERPYVETLAKAALSSYSEHFPSKLEYKKMQQSAFALLRSSEHDETAFELAVQYRFFEGLCELAIDHEKRRDASFFSLEPLFEKIEEKDVITSYTFSQYVLRWHTDQGHYGHVINYGRHAPKDLDVLMEKDERLRRYKWIPAMRRSFMDSATESCLANSGLGSLKEVQWALSMAKLTNMLCVAQRSDRRNLIEAKLDLVNAQQCLEGSTDGLPKPPEELIGLALMKLTGALSKDEQIRFAVAALAVCNSIEESNASLDYTAQVWAETLRLDEAKWTNWLKTESDLASPALKADMLTTTVFGALLEECRREQNMSSVTYGRHIESTVLDKIGNGNTLEFSRLLRSATADPSAYQGQSLIAAKY